MNVGSLTNWQAVLAGAVLLSVLIGLTHQAVATSIEARRFPPPGRLVDIGGYRLHILESGREHRESGPPIILDAGLGDCSLTWSLVQPELARFGCVYSYDRAGLGWSDSSPTSRTSTQIIRELRALISTAGIEKPYILVGHSFGGLNALLLASLYPEEVAGMVLVDSAHEEQPFVRFPLTLSLGPLTAPLGLPRLLARFVLSANPVFASNSKYPRSYRAIVARTRHALTFRQEYRNLMKSLMEARASARHFGEMPLTVVTAFRAEPRSRKEAEMISLSNALQLKLVGKATRGKQVVAEKSGHYVQHDQPELVVSAIRDVWESARRARSES